MSRITATAPRIWFRSLSGTAWGVDIVVTGSQKAFMLPTGLAFLAASERAWKVIEQNKSLSFYLDLKAYRKSLADQTTPYTPAVSLIFGLAEVLDMLEEEGLPAVIKRHELMRDMTRAAMRALNVPLMAEDAYGATTVTSCNPQGAFDAEALRKTLTKQYNITIAGGQQHMKGKIFTCQMPSALSGSYGIILPGFDEYAAFSV